MMKIYRKLLKIPQEGDIFKYCMTVIVKQKEKLRNATFDEIKTQGWDKFVI